MALYMYNKNTGSNQKQTKKDQAQSPRPSSAGGSKAGAGQTGGYAGADTSGNDYASLSGMSDVHRAALSAASQAWADANSRGDQAGMDAAHKKAEDIRALYSYSGGMDGTEYIPIAQQKTQQQPRQTFTYESAPAYVNRYQSLIDELRGKIINQDPFSYDPETDPAYRQYRDSYTSGGQQAMQNTLGQMSSRTGGMASSYAESAAQQTYNSYMSALADKIPELRQLAYEMYQDEGNKQRLNLQMISALEQEDYGKYQDLLAQYNTDRSFSYGQYRDQIADELVDRNFNYQLWRDAVADWRYDDETAYNRGIYSDETDYNRALQKAKMLAETGDFSGYRELGYSDEEIQALQTAYQAANGLLGYGGAGIYSGGGVGGNSGVTNVYAGAGSGGTRTTSARGSALDNQAYPANTTSPAIWDRVEDWVAKYGADSAENYIKEHYRDLGYRNYTTALAGWKNHLVAAGTSGGSGGGASGGTGGGNSDGVSGEKTVPAADPGTTDTGAGQSGDPIQNAYELGIGPVADDYIRQLAEEGKVKLFQRDGKWYCYWAPGYNAANYKIESDYLRKLLWQ